MRILIFLITICSGLYAQVYDDAEAAQKYALWMKQAIDGGRWSEAQAGIQRASDFINVSSDISFQMALVRSHFNAGRNDVIKAVDTALDVNRWDLYNRHYALFLKAQQLVAMRKYSQALLIIDETVSTADFEWLKVLSFLGMASSDYSALEKFKSQLLSSMNRYSRDPRFLRVFFSYARSRLPELSKFMPGDIDLLDLTLRRLPFLQEADPELAWMAAPFIRSTEDARRLVAAYRAGGIPNKQNRDFMPSAGSIPVALNLGLMDDRTAVEELFSGAVGFNSSPPEGIMRDGNPILDLEIINKVYSLLRSDEGREFFTRKLAVFTGCIFSDDDYDGYADSVSYYKTGVIEKYLFDRDQDNTADITIAFYAGVPSSAEYLVPGSDSYAQIGWERYPYVNKAVFSGNTYSFRPADFMFMPVSFTVLGGGGNYAGLSFPVFSNQFNITQRTFVSFCSSMTRSSSEFNGAVEHIFFNQAFPLQAVEVINGKYISFTEFEKGLPVIQYIDTDLDGRMETIRRFRRPAHGFNYDELFDYRSLVTSSISDWTGEGRYKTGEVYMHDGAVVYLWDMDGSGVMGSRNE
ncbi:MAG: hypothetical protein FWC19_07460 [Treponema sp.]|nr:hypothetical protein [Treponema sp.]MCL2272617.1 hypothetical protein [Treponema sp.]